MKTKKSFTPDIDKIIKNNKRIDVEFLKKSGKEFRQLQEMGITPKPYNLILPFSRSVVVDQ